MKVHINTTSSLSVFEDKCAGYSPRPFVIVETMLTIDGPRSRITDRRFPTLMAAERFMRDLAEGKTTNEAAL